MSQQSPDASTERPRQVTMGVVMAVVGSAILVLSLFDTLGRLRTPEMRETIDEFLSTPPGNGLGLEVPQVVELLRMLVYASGALAAMVLVFAIFVMQRHRAARIGLTVTAALLLLTAPVAGFLPILVAAAAALVWSRPARNWYAGRPATAGGPSGWFWAPADEQSGRGGERGRRHDPHGPFGGRPESGTEGSEPHGSEQSNPEQSGTPQPAPWTGPPSSPATPASGPGDEPPPHPTPFGAPATPPWQGGGAQPPAYAAAPPAWGGPSQGAQGWPRPSRSDADRRPATVTWAAVLTWFGGGAVALTMLLFAVLLSAGGDAFVEEFDRAAQGTELTLSADEVMAIGWAMVGVLLFWSVVSIGLAVLAYRRSNAGRIGLAISAVMAALVSLVGIMSIVSAVTLVMAGAAAVLLFTGGANAWYRRDRSDLPGGPPSGGGAPYGQGWPQQPPYGGPQPGPYGGPYPGAYPQGSSPGGQYPEGQHPGQQPPPPPMPPAPPVPPAPPPEKQKPW